MVVEHMTEEKMSVLTAPAELLPLATEHVVVTIRVPAA